MLRATSGSLVGFFLGLALAPAIALAQGAWGGGGTYLGPWSLPQQARARLDDEGQIVLTNIAVQQFPETALREEKRTRTEKFGDEVQTVKEVMMVPFTIMKIATHKQEYRLPLVDGIVFDLEGKPVKAAAAAARLKKGATVLFASRLIPSYYLTVFKPDTMFIKAGPESQVIEPPPALPAPEKGAEEGADPGEPPPAVPEPGLEIRDEGHPIPPQVALAKATEKLISIRSYIRDVEKEKMFLEEPADDGTVSELEIEVETETITDIVRHFPAKSIKATRADGKPVPASDLTKLLAASRCVLLAGDAKKVDPSYLEIVRPDALILTSPRAQIAPPRLPLPGPTRPGPAPVEPAPAADPQ